MDTKEKGGTSREAAPQYGTAKVQSPPQTEPITMEKLLADVAAVDAVERAKPVGPFRVKTFNKTIEDAINEPDPVPLFHEFWSDGELSCLFAYTNLGKSILAVQICDIIAKTGKNVVYFDFEQNEKQFQTRCTNPDTGEAYIFPESLSRPYVDPDLYKGDEDGKAILNYMEQIIKNWKADVVVVDNLTWLHGTLEKGKDAADVMKELKQIRKKCDVSMLVIAHTPKRSATLPLTLNDLAGSMQLANFFDSVFAVGRSAVDENLRYIKQLKCRHGEIVHGADNVVICRIERNSGGLLVFSKIDEAPERNHLKEQTDTDRAEREARIKDLAAEGKSCRAIADEMGMSKSTVNRIINSVSNRNRSVPSHKDMDTQDNVGQEKEGGEDVPF